MMFSFYDSYELEKTAACQELFFLKIKIEIVLDFDLNVYSNGRVGYKYMKPHT